MLSNIKVDVININVVSSSDGTGFEQGEVRSGSSDNCKLLVQNLVTEAAANNEGMEVATKADTNPFRVFMLMHKRGERIFIPRAFLKKHNLLDKNDKIDTKSCFLLFQPESNQQPHGNNTDAEEYPGVFYEGENGEWIWQAELIAYYNSTEEKLNILPSTGRGAMTLGSHIETKECLYPSTNLAIDAKGYSPCEDVDNMPGVDWVQAEEFTLQQDEPFHVPLSTLIAKETERRKTEAQAMANQPKEEPQPLNFAELALKGGQWNGAARFYEDNQAERINQNANICSCIVPPVIGGLISTAAITSLTATLLYEVYPEEAAACMEAWASHVIVAAAAVVSLSVGVGIGLIISRYCCNNNNHNYHQLD